MNKWILTKFARGHYFYSCSFFMVIDTDGSFMSQNTACITLQTAAPGTFPFSGSQ